MNRHRREVLVGDPAVLDHLATVNAVPREEHPLQQRLEEIVESLTPTEQELYRMKFGDQLSYREIAAQLGYTSHLIIQQRIARILKKVEDALG